MNRPHKTALAITGYIQKCRASAEAEARKATDNTVKSTFWAVAESLELLEQGLCQTLMDVTEVKELAANDC
jgi:hypothetical protein